MKQNLKKLLIDILYVQSESFKTSDMELFILNFVEQIGVNAEYDNGNIYITKGNSSSYPCIVSHTDTVHKILPKDEYTILTNDDMAIGWNKKLAQPAGCGGDDKVGIFICLQLLLEYDNIKVAFFKDEEVGCLGSYDANMDFFKDVRYVLQCDRRGNSDFINSIYGTPLQSKRFKRDVQPILNTFGYTATTGALTDVYALKENGVGVSVANMSCGYYDPHYDEESIVFADVDNCLQMCRAIFDNMQDVYHHEAPAKSKGTYGGYNTYKNSYKPYGYGRYYDSGWGGYDSFEDADAWSTKENTTTDDTKTFYDTHEMCESCQEWIESKDMQYNNDFGVMLCKSCNDYVNEDNKVPIIDMNDKSLSIDPLPF